MQSNRKVLGVIHPLLFLIIAAIVVIAVMMEWLPDNLAGGFAVCLVLGIGINWVGDQIPYLNKYGLGTILVLLVPAILVYVGFFPESMVTMTENFFGGYDMSSIVVPALIVGSVLGMERKALLKAGVRFIIPMALNIVLVTLAGGVIGHFCGLGFTYSMLYIAGPILGAGVSASAVPLSEIYAGYSGMSAGDFLTTLTAAVVVANIMVIIGSAVLCSIGRRNPNFLFKGFYGDGHNVLRNTQLAELDESEKENVLDESDTTTFGQLTVGFLITCGLYALARILAKVMPGGMHYYMWLIIPTVLIKGFGLFPKELDDAAAKWGILNTKVFTPALLFSLSIAALNFETALDLFSQPAFFITVLGICVATFLIAGGLSYLFGFYAVEGAIMTGIGLANAGGGGDIAVCSAAERMDLLPWLTICSRIGGAINMAWLTWLASMVM